MKTSSSAGCDGKRIDLIPSPRDQGLEDFGQKTMRAFASLEKLVFEDGVSHVKRAPAALSEQSRIMRGIQEPHAAPS